MLHFTTGFEVVGQVLLCVAGGAAAVILFAMAVLLLACTAGMLFDVLTSTLAKKWERTGHIPRNRLEQIILDNHKRLGR